MTGKLCVHFFTADENVTNMTVFTDNRQSTYLHLHKITSRGTSLFSTDYTGLFLYPLVIIEKSAELCLVPCHTFIVKLLRKYLAVFSC